MTHSEQSGCLVFFDEEKNTKKPQAMKNQDSQTVFLNGLDKLRDGLDDLGNIFKNYLNEKDSETSFLEERQLKKEVLQAVNKEAERAFAELTTAHKQLKDNNKDK